MVPGVPTSWYGNESTSVELSSFQYALLSSRIVLSVHTDINTDVAHRKTLISYKHLQTKFFLHDITNFQETASSYSAYSRMLMDYLVLWRGL